MFQQSIHAPPSAIIQPIPEPDGIRNTPLLCSNQAWLASLPVCLHYYSTVHLMLMCYVISACCLRSAAGYFNSHNVMHITTMIKIQHVSSPAELLPYSLYLVEIVLFLNLSRTVLCQQVRNAGLYKSEGCTQFSSPVKIHRTDSIL